MHMHSKYSDGTDSAIELYRKKQELGLKYWSITDHNNCLAYDELERQGIRDSSLIKGVEITTAFEGQVIEILLYGVDTKVINEWYKDRYSQGRLVHKEQVLLQRAIDKFKSLGFVLSEDLNLSEEVSENDHQRIIFADIIEHTQENEGKIDPKLLENLDPFYRKGIGNCDSKFFFDTTDMYPSLEEVEELAKRAEAKCKVIAHLYQYKPRDGNYIAFLNRLRKEIELDGVECYHSSFKKENTEKLLRYCYENGLYKTGGSDFHGMVKPQIKFGESKEGIHVPYSIVKASINKIIGNIEKTADEKEKDYKGEDK